MIGALHVTCWPPLLLDKDIVFECGRAMSSEAVDSTMRVSGGLLRPAICFNLE